MDGKTTLLMRVGAELAGQGIPTFFHKVDAPLRADELLLEEGSVLPPIVLLVDHLAERDIGEVVAFLERLQRGTARVVVVATVLKSLWLAQGGGLEALADVRYFDVSTVSEEDIELLATKIGPSYPSRSLINFPSGRSDESDDLELLLRKLRGRCKGQMGVLLAELQTGLHYSAYVASEINRIERYHGPVALSLLKMIAAFHRTDNGFPMTLLSRLIQDLDRGVDVLKLLREEGGVCRLSSEFVETRHPFWAESVFTCVCPTDLERVHAYQQLATKVSADGVEDRAFAKVLRTLARRGEGKLVLEVLPACERLQSSRLFAVLGELLRARGELEAARAAYRRALEIDPKEPSLMLSCARMEEDVGNYGSVDEPSTARWYYFHGTSIADDPNPTFSWNAWAHFEARLGNVGFQDASQPYSARWLYRKATVIDPGSPSAWVSWALLEEAHGNVGNLEAKARRAKDQHTARWLLRKGTQGRSAHPSVWRAWAMLETRLGNHGESFNELHTARWLYFHLLRIDPTDSSSWRAWAILERRLGNLGESHEHVFTARWMFHRAVDENPEDSSSWQAWGVLESEERNPGSPLCAERFTARWLFRRAIQADRTNSHAWNAWAHLERRQRRWAVAEGLFVAAAEVEEGGYSQAVNYCHAIEMAQRRRDSIFECVYASLAIEADESNGYAHFLRGRALAREGEYCQAEEAFLRAAELTEDSGLRAKNFYQAAVVAGRRGDGDRQEELLKRAVGADPRFGLAHARLGRNYGYQGKWREAGEAFRMAESLDPENDLISRWKESMESARRLQPNRGESVE